MTKAEETELKLRLKLEHCRRTTNRHTEALRKLQVDNARLRQELATARNSLLAERIARTQAGNYPPKGPQTALNGPTIDSRARGGAPYSPGLLATFLRLLSPQRRA